MVNVSWPDLEPTLEPTLNKQSTPILKEIFVVTKYLGGHFCTGSDLPVENQSENIECTKQMSSPSDSKMSKDSWLEQQQQKHIIIPASAPKNLGLVVMEESAICKKPRKRQILLNLVAF